MSIEKIYNSFIGFIRRFLKHKTEEIPQNMKYLIVGLGNPGSKYKDTRHNIGYLVVDEIIKSAGAPVKEVHLGKMARVKFKGRTLHLLKPTTFMNLSGKAVRYWMQKLKIAPDHLLVIVDDIHLPFGKLRMRAKGSDGGHNGLKDITEVLGSGQFARLRIGIGSKSGQQPLTDHVLGEWNSEEKIALDGVVEDAAEMTKLYTHIGLQRAMTRVNSKG